MHAGLSKPVRVVLGAYPATKLTDARTRARDAITDLTAGIHPGEREAERRGPTTRRANLFENVAADFVARHVSKRRTAKAITLRIKRELEARWAKRPVTDITRADVIRMTEEIVDSGRPEAARQTLAYCRKLFNWAIARDIYGITHSPCERIAAVDLIGPKVPRQRVLTDAELQLIWRATDGPARLNYPYGIFMQLLIILGCRRGELAGAQWNEIDLDKALWTLSGARTRTLNRLSFPSPPPQLKYFAPCPPCPDPSYFQTRLAKNPSSILPG